jgi:cytoskeletal protein CcmA (bactofilin family)
LADKREDKQYRHAGTDDGSQPSVIGATLVLKGELTLDEDLVIDGTVIGPIDNRDRRLSISPLARVRGDVRSEGMEIAGTVEGTVDSGSALLVRRTASLSGELRADNVVIEQGTNLENTVVAGRVTVDSGRNRR